MKPSARTIRRRIAELRLLIGTSNDPVEQRIAYAMESAIRWVTVDHVGWPTPAKDAAAQARMLHDELRRHPSGPT